MRSPRTVHGIALRLAPFAVALLAVPLITSAGWATSHAGVPLGTAESFAVLAGSGITNTGETTIVGDIGSFPTTTQTGVESVTLVGTNHGGDSVTQGAKDDLVTAYDDAASRTPATAHAVELGGETLLPGVYTSVTFGLTGTLTLDSGGDPDAVFVFQAGETLITEVNSNVVLVGVDPCRVVWQVGSSATFKTGTDFVGDVLALTSITAQTNATFQGRLLARNGAVTLDTNTITSAACVAQATTTTATTVLSTTTTAPAPGVTTTTAAPIVTTTTTPTPDGSTATPIPIDGPNALVPSGPGAGVPAGPAVPAAPQGPPNTDTVNAPPTGTPTGTPAAPPTGPGAPPARPSLPATGANLADFALTALGLLAVGGMLVTGGRRTRA